MEYLINDRKFNLSYQELREKHLELTDLSDEDFLKRLPEALHLACVICWLKELQTQWILADDGIIHELIHLLHIPDSPVNQLKSIRCLFKEQLQLH